MIKKLYYDIKSIDKQIINALMIGLKISLVIALLSAYILTLYNSNPFSHIAFESGLLIMKFSFSIISACITCSLAINQLRK